MAPISIHYIAKLIGGRIEGDGSREITGFGPINEAKEGAITFLANPKYEHFVYESEASAILVSEGFKPTKKVKAALIYVKDAYTSVSVLLEKFQSMQATKNGIEQPSYIHATAKTGNNIYVGAFAYIGENATIEDNVKIYPQVYIGSDVKIGQNTIIFPGVKIYDGTSIGKNCILHAGCVIGSDGFGFAPQLDGSYKKIPQTGRVVIKDHVEIGANTTIDRATLQATIIENGVKLDNLIQIAHNVEIGENTVIASQTGISGSTKIGKGCVIAGQVGMVGHITIADGTTIGAQSGVSKAITEKNKKWFGSPADEYKNALKAYTVFKRLPELDKKIFELEKAIKEK